MPGATSEKFEAHHERVAPDQYFEPHVHAADQLALIPGGARVRVGDSRWHLHGDHFAWVPALVEHEMQMVGAEDMFSLYLEQSIRLPQQRWGRPLVLPADPVGIAIVQSLCARQFHHARLDASLALLLEILSSTEESYDALAVPADPRARQVAEAILHDPQEQRDLADWSAALGVSSKTLHRAFLADTGLSFTQWRTRARVYAAERLLVDGTSVQETAEIIGYGTTTGFIKAFRQVFGSTPAVYIRAKRRARTGMPARRSPA
ncbi:HTH-type transcriptional regulator NimR [Microbacterium oxydans]|uniref:HTH-type transcriptional regulator RipA n=1 Tax=Microbacterium oxydans TaxID=82380 RepID=A0A0F0L781_9MICO|nr:AraC family transcriptional regulator [Microbacterium oxydans]KJL28165.1 HTH-type transcriptional repressor of iron proteins A [Microbacterium oxydans]CAH0125687.1 HTH-type transcriptional regulator NimR [Microbacterium oxydans]